MTVDEADEADVRVIQADVRVILADPFRQRKSDPDAEESRADARDERHYLRLYRQSVDLTAT